MADRRSALVPMPGRRRQRHRLHRIGGVTGGQVRALSFSDNGDAEGAVVFAGYGIVVPDSQGFSYDSYATLDVKDKIVVVLRYFPEDAEPEDQGHPRAIRRSSLQGDGRAAAWRESDRHRHRPAIRRTPARLAPMTFDTAIAGSGIVAVSVSGDVAATIFAGPDKPLAAAQKALDDANPHVDRLRDAGCHRVTFTRRSSARSAPATTSSAICRRPTPVTRDRETVGRDRRALRSSRPRRSGQHARWQGRRRKDSLRRRRQRVGHRRRCSRSPAALTTQPRKRNVLIAFWSGEELGLIGSSAFATKPPVPLDQHCRLSELRHGRPHAGQQAHRAGDRLESGVGEESSSRRTSPRDSISPSRRIRISRPTSRRSTPAACRR